MSTILESVGMAKIIKTRRITLLMIRMVILLVDYTLLQLVNGWFLGQKTDFAIPIAPSWADNESIESFDKMFIDTVNKVGDKVKKAIKDMNVMLNRLNDQTKVYIANKAPDSAKKIGDDYRNLKVAITSGIGQIGTAPQKGEFKTQADLEENKMTELDLMVENMVKQF